jgi:hypothetical protein
MTGKLVAWVVYNDEAKRGFIARAKRRKNLERRYPSSKYTIFTYSEACDLTRAGDKRFLNLVVRRCLR